MSATRTTRPGRRSTSRSRRRPALRLDARQMPKWPHLKSNATCHFSILIASGALMWWQVLPQEPPRETGASVTGAFEGWFKNPDGSFSLLLGYYNRNRKQEVDVPIGPNNRIEPGGPDRGQPTHFRPGRGWGLFAVKVPADFGKNKVTWTIVANGKPTVIPASLKPDYEISPLIEAAVGNTPPVLGFEEKGPTVQGPAPMT